MAAWRRQALESFPELAHDLNRKDYTIYQLFFDVSPMLRDAHDFADNELLRRIYSFAEWCLFQKAPDLWNAAGVAFYEHLIDDRKRRTAMLHWLSPKVIEQVWPLWRERTTQEDLAEIRRMLSKPRTRP